jgi:hypothetical protein
LRNTGRVDLSRQESYRTDLHVANVSRDTGGDADVDVLNRDVTDGHVYQTILVLLSCVGIVQTETGNAATEAEQQQGQTYDTCPRVFASKFENLVV